MVVAEVVVAPNALKSFLALPQDLECGVLRTNDRGKSENLDVVIEVLWDQEAMVPPKYGRQII